MLLFGAAMANGCRPLNEGRGVNPGDTTDRRSPDWGPTHTLNEGRGVNPGDTRANAREHVTGRAKRSTKAGA